MKAIAVRDGLYEGTRIAKGEEFNFDEKKYKSKSKNPWFVPADRAKVIKAPKQGPVALKDAGPGRNGKSFVQAMADKAKQFIGGVEVVVEGNDDLAK